MDHDDSEIHSTPTLVCEGASEELRMETVMEDSVVEYIFVAPHSPVVDLPITPTSMSTNDCEDFVIVSNDDRDLDYDDKDDNDNKNTSWWKTLQKYAFLATHKGGQWTSSMITYTNPVTNIFRTGHSSIHDCYDWVSDTSVDGGRLILPGQLVVWDDPNDTILDQALATDYANSSKIMVSAYDLLACQSSGRDEAEVLSSNTTLSFHSALIKVTKRRAYDLTKATSSVLSVSSSIVSQRIASLVSKWESQTGLLSNTVELVYQSLDWYFPSVLVPENEFQTEQSGTDDLTIELSTIKNIADNYSNGAIAEADTSERRDHDVTNP